MDLTGIWKYKEEFDYGTSQGECKIVQVDEQVFADFMFTEHVKDDYQIDVFEKTKGFIKEGKLLLESLEVKASDGDKQIDYLSNTYELHLVSEVKLVGSTYDSEDVCGVFTLEKL